MAAKVGLNFQLTASISRFEKAMNRVEKRLDVLDRSGRKAAAGISTLKNLAIGGAALKGISMLTSGLQGASNAALTFFGNIAKEADATAKLAAAIGINTSSLQTFQVIASRAGIGPEELSAALRKVTQRIGEAKIGVGEATKTFAGLGINLESLGKQAPDEQFLTIARSLAAIPDAATRSAFAVKLFEESGVKFLPLLQTLGTNFKQTKAEIDALGIGLSNVQFKNIEELNDRVDTLKRALGFTGGGGIGGQLLGNIAPFFTKIIEQIEEQIKNFRFAGVQGGTAVANYLTEAFFKGAILIGDFADSLYDKLIQAFTFLATIVEKLTGLLGKLVPDAVSPLGKKVMAQVRRDEKEIAGLEEGLRVGASTGAMTQEEIDRGKATIARMKEVNEINRDFAKKSDDKFIRERYGLGDGAPAKGVGGAARSAAEMFIASQVDAAKTPEQLAGAAALADRLGLDRDRFGNIVAGADERQAARRQAVADRSQAIKIEQAQAARAAQRAAEEGEADKVRAKTRQEAALRAGRLEAAIGGAARDQVLREMKSAGFSLDMFSGQTDAALPGSFQGMADRMNTVLAERADPVLGPLQARQDKLDAMRADAERRVAGFRARKEQQLLAPALAAGSLRADAAVASGQMTREEADAKIERDAQTLRANFERQMGNVFSTFERNALGRVEGMQSRLDRDFDAARARPQPRDAAAGEVVPGGQAKDGDLAKTTLETNRILERGFTDLKRSFSVVQVQIA